MVRSLYLGGLRTSPVVGLVELIDMTDRKPRSRRSPRGGPPPQDRLDGHFMPIDPRYLAGSGREIFTGNELLVKGALEVEGGVHLLTGYPGSPVANFFDVCSDVSGLLKEKGVRAYQANN